MITITGYTEIEFSAFIKKLNKCFIESGKSHIEIAIEIKAKTPQTIKNSLHDYEQNVSDEKLTKVAKSVGLDGFILWYKGEKYFYVKK